MSSGLTLIPPRSRLARILSRTRLPPMRPCLFRYRTHRCHRIRIQNPSCFDRMKDELGIEQKQHTDANCVKWFENPLRPRSMLFLFSNNQSLIRDAQIGMLFNSHRFIASRQ